jgi:hypothetical protein
MTQNILAGEIPALLWLLSTSSVYFHTAGMHMQHTSSVSAYALLMAFAVSLPTLAYDTDTALFLTTYRTSLFS